ncbi:MAG: hypothetical protein HC911_15285, partial [Chloroflexaceae bacterium]|nr:hypothetical protein [Chloroflexaceae bacterium]
MSSSSKLFKQDYGLPDPPILDIWREEGIEIGLQQGLQRLNRKALQPTMS